MGQDCVLCGARSDAHLVCAACDAALPRLQTCCVRCAAPLGSGGTCGDCLRRAPAFDAALAVFEYRFPVDRLVHRFKFAGDLAVGHWLGQALAGAVARAQPPELIVAPPLSAARLRERGFNQALELARATASATGARLHRTALVKVRETASQRALDSESREANLRGAFRCRIDVRGRHVAVIDDVITTGATASAVARALKEAGAASVQAWAVARTP